MWILLHFVILINYLDDILTCIAVIMLRRLCHIGRITRSRTLTLSLSVWAITKERTSKAISLTKYKYFSTFLVWWLVLLQLKISCFFCFKNLIIRNGCYRNKHEYTEIQKLGQGTFGSVWMCKDNQSTAMFALKKVSTYLVFTMTRHWHCLISPFAGVVAPVPAARGRGAALAQIW